MKKIFSIILCAAVVLTTGCSVVSQESYNSLVEENSILQSELNNVKTELSQIKSGFDICASMLGKPQESVSNSDFKSHENNIMTENIQYYENNNYSAKLTMTFDNSMDSDDIADFISFREKTTLETIQDFILKGGNDVISIYRYNDGTVICLHYWHKEESGDIVDSILWTSYGEAIADKYSML